MRDVSLNHSLNIPGVNEAVDFQKVCDAWNAVCDLNLHIVDSPSGANIVSEANSIDGPFGILGQSYLPCGAQPNTQLSQVFDIGEQWDDRMLFQVVLHEVGHALGLEHAPQGSGAIMEPFLNRSITAPQEWDVERMVARYGAYRGGASPHQPPTSTPGTPTLTFPESGMYQIQVEIGGRRIGSVGVRIPKAGTYATNLTALLR